jgi:hypothetical protein
MPKSNRIPGTPVMECFQLPILVRPGNGLAQHPFFYPGEWNHRKTNQTIFVVRDGKVVWTYDLPIKTAHGTSEIPGDLQR